MTDWYTEPSLGRTWLLADGTIMDEPVMEASGSKRRARVFGRQETAVSYADRDTALFDEVKRRAKIKGTYPWMGQSGAEAQLWNLGLAPGKGCTDLFAIGPIATAYPKKGKSEEPTRLYWTFKHPTLPISAQVVIRAETLHSTLHSVNTRLVVPDTRPNFLSIRHRKVEGPNWAGYRSEIFGSEIEAKFDRLIEDPPEYLIDAPLGTRQFVSERDTAKALLDSIRWADALESILIPDLRPSLEAPDWVELELVDTNMTAQLTTDLQEYLTSGPTVTLALEHYTAFQDTLKSLGMVLPKVSENQIMRLLLAGEDAATTVTLNKPIDLEDGSLDHEHTLAVHLATGTLSVRCSVKAENKEEIGQSWAEAQAIASITGKTTELMAYATEFARTNDERKTRRLIKARKAGIVNHP